MTRYMIWLGLGLTLHGFGLSIVGLLLLFDAFNHDGGPLQIMASLLYLAAWIIQTYAGSRARRLRNRSLIVLAVALCPLGVVTVIGAPCSLILLFFGFLLLRDSDVSQAFADVARGASLQSVLKPRRYGDERDDYDDDHLGP